LPSITWSRRICTCRSLHMLPQLTCCC
jgi:hypothetical protein